MKTYNVEVAVAFTNHTWTSVITTVEDFTENMIEKAAEDKVLEDFAHGDMAVSFVKTLWIDPKEEE